MKKIFVSVAAVIVLIAACSKNADQTVKLTPGTDTYLLAQKIAKTLPYFNPDDNNILAEGKGIKVTTGALIQNIYLMFGKVSDRLASMPEDRLRDIIQSQLDNVVNEKLILNQVQKSGIKADQSKIDSVLQMQYEHSGGEEKFMEQLEKNNMSIDDIIADIKNQILINTYFDQKFGEEVVPTEEDLMNAYNSDVSASVRHILFLTQGKSDSAKAEIRKKAEEVLARAKAGENFEKLVKKYSEDPGSKDKGGLYEDFKRGDMVKPFEDASFDLPVGSISDLVETQYGYHIIKVIGRKKETRPFDEVKEMLAAQLKRDKQQKVFGDHVEELKQAANIEYAPF